MKNKLHRFILPGTLLIAILGFAACSAPASNPSAQPTAAAPNQAAPIATAQPTALPTGVVTATPVLERISPDLNPPSAPLSQNLMFIPQFDRVNLNAAGGDEFSKFPVLDSGVVAEFLQNRPYGSIQEFRQALSRAHDASTVSSFERYVYVPIDVNASDTATLMQIPGVTEEIAAQLISARPYESNDFFLAYLSAHLPPDDVTFAQNFLMRP